VTASAILPSSNVAHASISPSAGAALSSMF
jgi:hypothetical protein